MTGQLKAAWRYTAMPIMTVFLILIAGGVYLQSLANRIQREPLTISVKTLSGSSNVVTAETVTYDVEPEVKIVSQGAAGRIQELLDDEQIEEALQSVQREIDLDQSLAQNTEFVLVHARALSAANRHDEAVALLETLSPTPEMLDRVEFAIGLNKSRGGDKIGAIDAYVKAAEANPLFYEAWFNLGVLYMGLDRYEWAIDAFETAVPLASGTRRARTLMNLAGVYRSTGEFGRAEELYIEAMNLYPGDLLVRLDLAELYATAMLNFEAATEMYEEVRRLDEGNGMAAIGLSEIYLLNDNRLDAYNVLEQTIVLNPTHEGMRRSLAVLYMEDERYDEALAQLTWLENNGSDTADALFLQGRIAYAERDFSRAADLYTAAFEASSGTHVESLNNLGLSLKALFRLDEAEQAFNQALALNPDYRNAHYNLGLLHLDREEFFEARDAFLNTVQRDPGFSPGWYNLAFVHSRLGANQDAITAYEEALRIDPANQKARLNLAVQYGKIGSRDRAIEQYRLVIALNPSNPTAWYNMAISLKAVGNFTEAEEAYRQAISLDPSQVKYWQNLSVILSSQNRLDEVVSLLRDATDIHPESTSIRYNLAIALKKSGNEEAAITELENAVALDPGYTKAWLALADTQSDMDNHEQAKNSYQTALELDPDDAYTGYQLGKEYYKLGDYRRAEQLFLDALDQIQDNAWIWYNLGKTRQQLGLDSQAAFDQALEIDLTMGRLIYRRLERIEDSLELLNEVVSEDPGNVKTRLQLAELLQREGRLDEALDQLDVAVSLAPEDSEVWLTVADVAWENQKRAEAEEAYRTARGIDPNSGKIAYRYALFLQDTEGFAAAVPLFEEAVTAYASPYFAYKHLGESLYELKRYQEATTAFTEALKLRPDSVASRYDLAKAKYRAKDYPGALGDFQIHVALRPDYEWSHIWLGRALTRAERYDEAESAYRAALSLKPGSIQPYISLGDLNVIEGRDREAVDWYQRALDIDPTHESTQRKLEGLQKR